MAEPRARITLAADDRTGPAFQSLRQRLSGAQGAINGLSAGFAGIGGSVGTLISGFGITALVKGVTDGLGALKDLSEATGASIENLSGLEDIARRTGTSFDTVGASLIKLNQALNNADNREIAKVLDAIGLSAKELRALDPAQALLATSKAFDRFAEGGGRARAELLLFGRSQREVAAFTRELVEAGELNATVTQKQVQEADKFNKQLSAIGKSALDVARDISGPLVSSLNDFFAVLARARANPGGLLGGISEKFNVDFLRARLQATNEEIERMGSSMQRAQGILAQQPDSIRAKATLAEFAQLQKAAADYQAQIDQILYAGGKRRPANEGGGGLRRSDLVIPDPAKPPKTKAEPPDPIQQLVDASTGAQFDKLIDLSAQLDARFHAGKISGTDYARALEVIDKQLTALGPKTEKTVDALGDFIDRIAESRAADLSGLIGQSTGAQYDALAARAQLLAEAFEQGDINAQGFARGAEVLGKQFDALAPKLEQTTTFAEQAARNIQDVLGDSLASALDGKFNQIGRSFGDMLKRLVAQAAAAQLTSAIFGEGYGKTTSNLGGWAGDALKWLSTSFGGPKAAGGPVQANRAYLVGERGPELMVPTTAGTIVPNGALGSGGASVFNVNVQGDASENTIRLIRGALAQFEARQMMRGA